MGMTSGGRGTRAEINITPMIDILLVLIIMFLVITPTKSVGLNAAVPQESQDAEPSSATPTSVVIYARGGGEVEINQQPVAVVDLRAKLMAVFHGRPDATVFVGGERHLEFGEIATVIDVAKGAGIARVGLMPGGAR